MKVYYIIYNYLFLKGVLYFMCVILLGFLLLVFFFVIFIINKVMNVFGMSWVWIVFFCFLFVFFILFFIVLFCKNFRGLWEELKKYLLVWIGWGFVVGIGFYFLLSFLVVFFLVWFVVGIW